MESRRRMLYLRIAVTALSLTACVLLVALWVRSYWWNDYLELRSDTFMELGSKNGHLDATVIFATKGGYVGPRGWTRHTQPSPHEKSDKQFAWDFDSFEGHSAFALLVPHWLLVLVIATCAAGLWIRRFSLRTLLIGTTLIAVGLGIIISTS